MNVTIGVVSAVKEGVLLIVGPILGNKAGTRVEWSCVLPPILMDTFPLRALRLEMWLRKIGLRTIGEGLATGIVWGSCATHVFHYDPLYAREVSVVRIGGNGWY